MFLVATDFLPFLLTILSCTCMKNAQIFQYVDDFVICMSFVF